MQELEERCTCQPVDDDGAKYFRHEQRPACEQWWHGNSALVDELHLKPWEWPAYENPDPKIERNYEPDADAVARYHALRDASEVAKRKSDDDFS
jgi:hypothetical protein